MRHHHCSCCCQPTSPECEPRPFPPSSQHVRYDTPRATSFIPESSAERATRFQSLGYGGRHGRAPPKPPAAVAGAAVPVEGTDARIIQVVRFLYRR